MNSSARSMTPERYERWSIVPDVDTPCSEAVLHLERGVCTVRLCLSGVVDGPSSDLSIRFTNVIACMSHEEFSHPWNADAGTLDLPRLEGGWATYAFPMLDVKNSRWIASFSSGELLEDQRSIATHVRFLSMDNTVDVLYLGEAVAEWVPGIPADEES